MGIYSPKIRKHKEILNKSVKRRIKARIQWEISKFQKYNTKPRIKY